MDDTQFLLILGSLSAVVGAASVAGNVLHWRIGGGHGVRVAAAFDAIVLSRLTMLGAVVAALWLGANFAIAFFAVVSVVALRQFMTAAGVAPGDDAHGRSDRLLYVAVVLVQYALVASRAYALFSVCIPLVSALLLPILSICGRGERRPLECAAKRYWAVMLCVYCLSCMPALLMLDIPGFAGKSVLLLLFFLLVAQAAAAGRRLVAKRGTRRAATRAVAHTHLLKASVGASMGAFAAGCALCWLTPFTPVAAGAMALAMALAGLLGATVMTAIRRDAAFKTWAAPVGARAEVMDHVGSLCFAAPVLLQLTHYFYAA